MVFVALTAEESGLLGSAYYGENPVYPLAKTAAVINMDGLNQFGPTRDVTVIGLGASELDDYAKAVASAPCSTSREPVRPTPRPRGFHPPTDSVDPAVVGAKQLGGFFHLGK